MSRPVSAKLRSNRPLSGRSSGRSSGRPVSAGGNNKASPHGVQSGGVSYEDLLVAQYLEELKKSATYGKPPHSPASPYLQRLSHTHIVPTPNLQNTRPRPQSAHVGAGANKPRVDAKFIADPELWDPVSPRDEQRKKRQRPVSAPVYKRPLSATYGGYNRPTSAKSAAHRARSLYKRQPHTIVVTAYKNGTRDVFCRAAAPNIKVLLEYCTEKLCLANAARRVFLEDGSEVFTPKEIPRDATVFVSMGEAFKNPFKPVKQQNEMAKTSTWTMNGVVWNQDAKKKSTKPKLSKRFRSLIEQSRRRVLVFRNGHGSQGIEIVADPNRFEDFLVACTAKLDLGSYARFLYDWEGQQIDRLDDAPVLDQCLQTWSTPVIGPIWVSKGEGFSPAGVEEFLKGLIAYTQGKLREAKHYKTQLEYGQSEDTKDKVEIVAILSMSETEISETQEIVKKDIEDFTNALNRLKEQRDKLQGMLGEEVNEGYQYKLKHIDKFQADHRMVGTQGLRLKVYENGSYEDPAIIYFNIQQAMKGVIGNDQSMLITRLLDQCSSSTFLANPKKNTALKPVAQKLFTERGQEVKNVHNLEFDQEVWLSFGEPFKNLFTYVLTASFDSVSVYERSGGDLKVMKEPLRMDEIDGQDKSSKWEVWHGVPPDPHTTPGDPPSDAGGPQVVGLADYSTGGVAELPPGGMEGMEAVNDGMSTEIRGDDATILRNKETSSVMMFANLVMDTKTNKATDVWPENAQKWLISKAGYIYNKSMPALVLSVLDAQVSTTLGHPTKGSRGRTVEGWLVGLQKKQSGSPNQQWRFTPEANICSTSHPDLCLTFLGAQYRRDDTQLTNDADQGATPSGQPLYAAVCERTSGKDSAAQRWALKQEKYDNLGQWKHTRANAEWHKLAYSWPITEEGEINEDYDWPMEGYVVPYAPPLKKKDDKTNSGSTPLRLLVMKNGVREVSKAVPVVGPDLTNMRKDAPSKDKKKSGQKSGGPGTEDSESIAPDEGLHCDDNLTVLKLEFILFLERATSMLDLPFAARRLYDSEGREHFSLSSLARDQLVYVSCGEPWTDPSLSKAEQQRRYLLANLAGDVDQIRTFVALRDPDNLVLEVDSSLSPGNKLTVNDCAMNSDVEDNKSRLRAEEERRAALQEIEERERERADKEREEGEMTSHEIAHRRAEDRLNKLKWPWERVMNGGLDEDDDPDEQHYSNKDLYRKFKSKPRRKTADTLTLQKFAYEDGVLATVRDGTLVLAIKESEGRVSEVVLERRRQDSLYQRWILQDNGLIQAKYNTQMVLTVSLPSGTPGDDGESTLSYRGCTVTVQAVRAAQFGRANQRWEYDANTGFIRAFHTDKIDKEITAANKANVCTFAVMGDTSIDQPGYVVQMQDKGHKTKKLLVCASCARAMRGRHKLEKVQGHIDFACSMGNAKELGVKQVGSFQCLNGKVDLSSFEAEHTLEEWESQLERLRAELSVRVIAREISAAHTPYTVKTLVYKNGDGRLRPGEIVVGSSIAGILEQSTGRLGLSSAARRLYTADGVLVLDTDDLVEWARQEYVRQAQSQIREKARARRRAERGDAVKDQDDGPKLMDKVELDSETETTEEEEEEEDEEQEEVTGGGRSKRSHLRSRSSKLKARSKDLSLGYNAVDRADTDSMANVVIIPNPGEAVQVDGHITAYKLYARTAGQICLQVYRPSDNDEDPSALYLTGQVTYDITTPGEQVIDLSAQPVRVKVGDVLGFYSVAAPVIPYDTVGDAGDQPKLYLRVGEKPALGQMLMFEMYPMTGSCAYSLSAQIRPADGSEVPTSRGRPKTSLSRGAGQKKKNKRPPPQVDPPPLDMVLRYPIEVWVSTGEQFIEPERVESSLQQSQSLREQRAAVSYELDKERHVLRHLQGRRLEHQDPGAYRGTRDPARPVLTHGHWTEAKVDELAKHDMVHQLETHLAEMRSAQKPKDIKACNSKTTKRLYTQPAMKRVLIFPNGESLERAQYVWGETLAQLCNNATSRLGLRKAAKYLFCLDGTLVEDTSSLERDQILCVSTNRTFLRPKESQQVVEIKANWGRARKQYGRHATDIIVTSDKNPDVDVDPFGPSSLAGGKKYGRKEGTVH